MSCGGCRSTGSSWCWGHGGTSIGIAAGRGLGLLLDHGHCTGIVVVLVVVLMVVVGVIIKGCNGIEISAVE